MRKWTISLMLLFGVLLLIFFAFLPALAGVLQDAGVEKKLSYRPLHSIAPYISENGSGLEFVEKIAFMNECEISSVVPALAAMTPEQVRDAAENGLQPYVDAGIMRLHEGMDFHATPHVAISLQDGQRYFLFWEVRLFWLDNDGKSNLSVRIDDETGEILHIDGYVHDLFADGPGEEMQNVYSESFARIWLEQAGLWEKAKLASHETEQFMGETQPVRYEILEGVDKPLFICFCVTNYGEYMMWIENMPI